ncbi:MAG: hypothetical protein J7J72_05650, partial [Bacteroidales bacterium]|nr:hypothetical protein [Bacteroidales bacterium]
LFINGVLKKITRIPETPLGFLTSEILISCFKNYIRAFVAFLISISLPCGTIPIKANQRII